MIVQISSTEGSSRSVSLAEIVFCTSVIEPSTHKHDNLNEGLEENLKSGKSLSLTND